MSQTTQPEYCAVPISPTPDMKRAGIDVEIYDDDANHPTTLSWEDVTDIFQAMVTAAPQHDCTDGRDRLHKHMGENHGVILLESEMADIEHVVMSYAVQPQKLCTWKEENPLYTTWTYETDCGRLVYTENGDPAENDMHYCWGCGGTLVVEKYPEPEQEDE